MKYIIYAADMFNNPEFVDRYWTWQIPLW